MWILQRTPKKRTKSEARERCTLRDLRGTKKRDKTVTKAVQKTVFSFCRQKGKNMCPYYRRESNFSITCAGIAGTKAIATAFPCGEKREKWKTQYCNAQYERCPVIKLYPPDGQNDSSATQCNRTQANTCKIFRK